MECGAAGDARPRRGFGAAQSSGRHGVELDAIGQRVPVIWPRVRRVLASASGPFLNREGGRGTEPLTGSG
jgi:hypothetical protein